MQSEPPTSGLPRDTSVVLSFSVASYYNWNEQAVKLERLNRNRLTDKLAEQIGIVAVDEIYNAKVMPPARGFHNESRKKGRR